MKTFIWLIRREFWENRAIWTIPAALGVLITLAALFGRVDADAGSAAQNRASVESGLLALGVLFCALMSLYSTWYLVECLYADRKDRSVLFWKSLPITDGATVLSKLFTALIAIPVVYMIAADVTALLVAFIVSLRTHWTLGTAPWQPGTWIEGQVLWLYVIASSALWYLPLAGALMVVSAWAKRAALLWSTLLPIAAILAEQLFLHSHRLADILQNRLFGYFQLAFHGASAGAADSGSIGGIDAVAAHDSLFALINPAAFLSNTATWVGALAGAALVAAAVRLRMSRTDS